MKNILKIKERFMKDPLQIRLGGLAANLSRVNSFTSNLDYMEGVNELLDESKYFIEWTANETEMEMKMILVNLQIQLALWQLRLPHIWNQEPKKQELAKMAKEYSDRILKISGLLK